MTKVSEQYMLIKKGLFHFTPIHSFLSNLTDITYLFFISSTSCWFVSKMLNLAGVIVNHSWVFLNLVCPTSPDGGACSLRDERSRRHSFPVGSERKRSIWLSLPRLISVTQHSSSSSKWPYYPQEAGCSQYIRGKRQPCGCFSLSLFVFVCPSVPLWVAGARCWL